MPGRSATKSETEFLERLETIRALFDQLRDLPKLTPAEFANERAESAVLAPAEYVLPELPEAESGWTARQLKWHRTWNHEGYILAFSEAPKRPFEYLRYQMVVNERGGIFEWCHSSSERSQGQPESCEAKLPKEELASLKEFLAKMPPSDASGKEVRFIVSFMNEGVWTTRTYKSLPPGSRLELILNGMIKQSAHDWDNDDDLEGIPGFEKQPGNERHKAVPASLEVLKLEP